MMKNTKFDIKKIFLAAVALMLLAVIATSVGVYAKYLTEKNTSGQIKVQAKLADEIAVLEHEAVKQPDGSYTLDTAEVTGNSYVLMPGVDVPKDPFVRVIGYTGLPAYLFVEIIEENIPTGTPREIDYTVAEGWTSLNGVTGENGGKVYYRELTQADSATGSVDYAILDGDQLIISDTLQRSSGGNLKFYAAIAQLHGENPHAAAIYGELRDDSVSTAYHAAAATTTSNP